jgi:hypothetical protein
MTRLCRWLARLDAAIDRRWPPMWDGEGRGP